jgi:hypothetical protein
MEIIKNNMYNAILVGRLGNNFNPKERKWAINKKAIGITGT